MNENTKKQESKKGGDRKGGAQVPESGDAQKLGEKCK